MALAIKLGLILTTLVSSIWCGSPLSLDPALGMFSFGGGGGMANLTDSGVCSSIWCDSPSSPSLPTPSVFPFKRSSVNFIGLDEDGDNDLLDELQGFWLDGPPDDILYMPPPPMPPGMQSLLASMENDSLRQYIITDENDPEIRCNFCKLFAEDIDARLYEPDGDLFVAASKDLAHPWTSSSLYVLLLSAIILFVALILILVKFKKLRIFPMSESCPILTGGFGGHGHHHHHKSNTSSSSSSSACDSHLSPVVNEKSPQSIIMDHTLAKKSVNGTAAKYWRRNGGPMVAMGPNVLSLGGSSTCISSEHPYSDAASCTSSPVYAELDASIAGSNPYAATPPMIGPPYYHHHQHFNAYSEVPDNLRVESILSDSSSYDNNAAYLSTAPTAMPPGPFYNTSSRSLRRLAAARSMQQQASSISTQPGNNSFTPLLAGHPYHYQPTAEAMMTLQQQHQQQASNNGHFHFLTGGRPLAAKKKARPGHQMHSTPQARSSLSSSSSIQGNHYVVDNHKPSFGCVTSDVNGSLLSDIEPRQHYQQQQLNAFSSFLDNGRKHSNGGSGMQYTEMPLLNATPFGMSTYRSNGGGISETHSNQDLNSSASSSSGGGGGQGHGSGSSSATSLKRPLPPVPRGGGDGVRL